ncbi:MAG: hypothetical protein ABII68_03740 [Pseudomonadota bacterium]
MKKPVIPELHELFEIHYENRRSVQHIEREYLDLRIRLRDAEADLRSDPQNRELTSRADYLKDRVKDLENTYSWVTTGRPSEIPFWITPS